MGDVDHRPTRLAKGIDELLYVGDRSHEEGHVDPRFRHLPCDVTKAAVGMNEVVLHIDDNQCRLTHLRAKSRIHLYLPGRHGFRPWVELVPANRVAHPRFTAYSDEKHLDEEASVSGEQPLRICAS